MSKTLTIQAKCSDLCFLGYSDDNFNEYSYDGYVPEDLGIGRDGDYIELTIDVETHKLVNAKNLTEKNLLKVLKPVK